MKNHVFLGILLLIFTSSLSAQVPSNYYSSVDGLTGDALWTALNSLIDNPNTTNYSDVDNKFVSLGTDEDPNNSANIIFFYTRDSRPSNSFTGNGNGNDNTGGWNKEHVWPRSRGVGDSGDDQQDMHMIRPTDVDVNSRRAALDFGIVSGNNTANVSYFEPHDEVKGDCARILFYMITAYKGSLELVETVTNSSSQLGNLSLMVQWNLDDPVDDFERNRNDIVYDFQGNANPFVNHPEWINEIWGEGTASASLNTSSSSTIDFGNVISGQSSSSQSYQVIGSNLQEDVSVSVSAPFELSLDDISWSTQIIMNQANAEAGSNNTVYIRFSPSVIGSNMGSIIHQSSGQSETIVVKGEGVGVTGVADEIGIKIYPNPVSDLLKIEGLNISKEIRLFSSNGQSMPIKVLTNGLDISDLEHGLYYLIIKSENDTQVHKVLVK